MSRTDRPNVLVLGAGVVGLNTAMRIQKDLPDVKVTVRSEKFSPNTTSNVAAGLFRPSAFFESQGERMRTILKDSWDFYNGLRLNYGANETGVYEVPLYIFSSKHPEVTQNSFLSKYAKCYRKVTPRELNLVQPKGKYKFGTYTHSLMADCDYFLPWAMEMIKGNGGNIEMGKVETLEELGKEEFDVIVNCTGFASKFLCNDKTMVANRGQVFNVRAPWIRMAFYGDYDTYIIPGIDYVTLGGCRQLSNMKDEIDPDDSRAIWNRVTEMIPNLEKAEIIREAAAYRPTRKEVRIEKEILGSDELKIVHNYGHCGYGVMSSPGSAIIASRLVQELL